jgi:hypothetical protein
VRLAFCAADSQLILSDGCCRDIAGDAVDIYQAVLEKICRDIAEILPIIVRQF